MTEFFISLKFFFSIFSFKLALLLYLLYQVTCILKPSRHKNMKIFTSLFSWVKIWISLRSKDLVPSPHNPYWKDIVLILGSSEVNPVVLPQKTPQYSLQCSWSEGLLQHKISITGLTPSVIRQPVSHQIFVSLNSFTCPHATGQIPRVCSIYTWFCKIYKPRCIPFSLVLGFIARSEHIYQGR